MMFFQNINSRQRYRQTARLPLRPARSASRAPASVSRLPRESLLKLARRFVGVSLFLHPREKRGFMKAGTISLILPLCHVLTILRNKLGSALVAEPGVKDPVYRKLFTLPTSFGTPEVKMWVKARAASPARPASPREKGAITTLRSELFMEKSFSSLSFF